MFDSIRQALREWYADRNEREQLLLRIAGIVLPLVAVVFIGVVYNQSLNAIRHDIDEYERTLQLLGDVAPQYRKRNESKETGRQKFAAEAIEDNDIKLTSFVATHATAVGIQVDTFDESERQLGGEDQGGSALKKRKVDVEIRKVPVDKLRKLMERIEEADKPVVIERVTLSRKQGDTGKVRATLVVATFKRQAKG